MKLIKIYNKAFKKEDLTTEEALFLYEQAPLSKLLFIGNELRKSAKNN